MLLILFFLTINVHIPLVAISALTNENAFNISFDESMASIVHEHGSTKDLPTTNPQLLTTARLLYENLKDIPNQNTCKIPHIMHTIWLGNDFPAQFHMYKICWKQKHPQWTHILWVDNPDNYKYGQEIQVTDEVLRKISQGEYQGRLLVAHINSLNYKNGSLINNIDNQMIRSQIARYEIISLLGGVFVNADCQCFKPLDTLTYSYDFFGGISYTAHKLMINDALFGARPQHPLFKHCIQAIKNINPANYTKDLNNITDQFTHSFLACTLQNSDINIIFPVSYFFPILEHQRNLSEQQKTTLVKPETFSMCHWQESICDHMVKNPKYVIGLFQPGEGLFSSLKSVMNHLIYCVRFNKVPTVTWDHDSAYYQQEGHHGQANVWEYYFEPVSPAIYTVDDYIWRTYAAPDNTGIAVELDHCYTKKFRKNIKDLVIDRFIKVKPYILEKVQTFYDKHLAGKKNIAIHLRGTDKHTETKHIPLDTILNTANQLADKDTQFFIATDEQQLLDHARQMLKGPVISYESFKSFDGAPTHISRKHEYNRAKLGEEALIEVLLLSKCNTLIHTNSNFAYAALLFNPELNNIWLK